MYTYSIQAWKDGSSVLHKEVSTKREANRIAKEMMSGKCGKEVDAVDIYESDDELRLHSKTAFTLWNGTWTKAYNYVGEDD